MSIFGGWGQFSSRGENDLHTDDAKNWHHVKNRTVNSANQSQTTFTKHKISRNS